MNAATLLLETVNAATPMLVDLSTEQSAHRPAPGKWSPREVIGHLIDSAANNHRRFVSTQFSETFIFDGYAQDDWVRCQGYQESDFRELYSLWRSYNLHLCHLIERIAPEALTRSHMRHNLDQIAWKTVPQSHPVNLQYLVIDYVNHVRHHLEQSLSRQISGAGESASGALNSGQC